jgi:hypothetical protein
MKKFFFMAVALVALTATTSMAQGRFSVGADLALPMGDFGDVSGLGFGGSLKYEGAINDNINWTGSVGYLSFSEKDDSGVKISMIPILAGAKYYFNTSFEGFYAGAELGLSINKAKVDLGDFGGEVSDSSTDFAFAPQIGYHLANIDLTARYLVVSTDGESANSLGFRVAYVFGGK